MNDGMRVRMATRNGRKMLGPLELQRCHEHPRRWMTYRWEWIEDIESGEPVVVRGCPICQELAA